MVKDSLSFKEFAVQTNQVPAVTKNTGTQQKPIVKRKRTATVQHTTAAPADKLPELKRVTGIPLTDALPNEKVVQGKPIINFSKGIKLEGKPVETANNTTDEKVVTVVGYSSKRSVPNTDSTKANNPL